MTISAIKFGMRRSNDLVKLVKKSKNLDIADLKTLMDSSGLVLPKNITPNKLATTFDCAIFKSKTGKKHIISLKNEEGKLIQRFSTDFGQKEINKTSDYLTQVIYNNGDSINLNQKTNNISTIPKHHRRQTSYWNETGNLEQYKETDVILYKDELQTKHGIKTTYVKDMPERFSFANCTDINETTTIEGLLDKKHILYQRRSTFNTKTGEIENWKGFQKGLRTSDAEWLDSDKWLHCRVQSNPEHIANSVLHQKNITNVELDLIQLPISNSGNYFMIKGQPHIELNKELSGIRAFSTANHEGNHLLDEKKIIEFLSLQLRNKSEKQVIEYASKNNNELAYIYKQYLNGHYGDKNKIRKIAYERKLNIDKKEVMELIRADKNYVSPSVNLSEYKTNFLEICSNEKEKLARAQRRFYTEDYINLFTPDLPLSDFTTFF